MKTLILFLAVWMFIAVYVYRLFPLCAVPAQQGQDEFLYTQKHSGTSCSTQTANGVQSRSAGMQGLISPSIILLLTSFQCLIVVLIHNRSVFFHRFSVCRSYWVQTWLWTRCEAVTRASASRTFSMVRMLEYCIGVGMKGLMMIFNTAFALCLLTDPAQSEVMGEPHVMVEYKLGLLWKILQNTQLTLWLLLVICVLWIKKTKQKLCSVLHLYDSSLTFISIKLWESSWKYLYFFYYVLVCLTV